VASSFETILEVDQVGINDDFFKLGGHSLRALRLVNLLEERTGKEVQIKHIFESSRVVELANVLESLGEGTYERIPIAEEKSAYAMSSTQKRMYLLWKLSPQEVAYNMPAMMKFESHLDETELTKAVNEISSRHEILRTRFTEQAEMLVQVISAWVEIEVTVHELREADVKAWYAQAVKPFDLENGPLYRLELIRTEARDYVFVDMHHIISDGMSSNIFASEINQLMSSMPLPIFDRQYKDYSEWLKLQDLSESEKYWVAHLEDYPVLELPTDYPRPREQAFAGATEQLILDEATTEQVKALIQKTNSTAYMFFMGLISVLLGKLSNQDDLVIGSPVSGRTHRDTEAMLGMFVNTLAMRVSPQPEKSFASYLEELKQQTLEAQDHQMYPFEDLVDQIVESRDRSRNPIFDVLMVYQNNEAIAPLMGTVSFEEVHASAKFDLTFNLADDGAKTYLDLTYATSLFSQETIERYLVRFTQLLEQVLADENRAIKDLNVLLKEEEYALTMAMGSQYTPYPKDKTLVALIEEQVAKNQDATAVIYNDVTLTYAELNEKANQLAHYLIETYAIKPEDKIGLLLDRSEWMIISILAILKAGAAYVAISPEYPQDRITYIEEIAALKTTLVEANYASQVSEATSIRELDLTRYSIHNPVTELTSANLAYILFTSGTTGRPKGVMVEHQSVTNIILSLTKTYGFEADKKETTLFFANYVFDAVGEQVFLPLLNGYPMVVMPDRLWMDQQKFTNYLNAHKVTYIEMTPSFLLQADLASISQLKYVLAGGESVTPQLVEKVGQLGVRFINAYGPAETTITTSTYEYDGTEKRNFVGTPAANTTVYILDQSRRLVPRGTIGELYIGGVQVSRGYVNQPELTAERFIANPFQTEAQKAAGWNERLYQSGDLVSMLEDGPLEYHGRTDFQVKIRGYRIELGEIEETLLQIPGIKQAYVTAIGEVGTQYLGAYYVAEEAISNDVLDQEISKRLPEFMIPSGYQHMREFPLTVNGKLDHRALPEISFDSSAAYVAPSTAFETLVATSYEDVLERDKVGLNDDFFKLGGHSLRALRLANLLAEKTSKAVQVRHVFDAPKVSQLAALIEGLAESQYERIPQAEVKEVYEMSSTQKRMYLLWKFNPDEVMYNMPGVLRFDRHLDEAKLASALNQLTARHEILRTTFTEEAGELVQVISARQKINVLATEIQEAEVSDWYARIVEPFNLETGPLYRVKIARTEARDYLFVDMHHIISDGMSITLFINEMNQLMEEIALPIPDRQYKDYSEWMKVQDLNASEAYWVTSLADYPVLELPTDYSRPAEQVFTGASQKLMLDAATSQKIKELTQACNTTAYMFFMALISVLLAKLANQDDLIIGSPISGRIHRDTEHMLGMFVNTLAMRMKPNGTKTFVSYLEELKTQSLAAQDHQIYPFEDVVDRVVKTRDHSRNPLFDVLVVYQNNEAATPIPGAQMLEPVNVPAQMDLSFTLSDDKDQFLIELTYATSLFSHSTIQTYFDRLTSLLDQIVTNVNQPIQELSVLLPIEKQELFEEMGSDYATYPTDETITKLFEEQVKKTPNQPAVVYNDLVLTYAELDAKANKLAHYLIETYELKPEDKVGLLLDRSEWMIISILGILKAGGAYVPISPQFPQERITYIESAAELKTTFVEAKYASNVTTSTIIRALDLSAYPATAPEVALTPASLAYIIFTSGTTGKPKGVMLEHRHVNNLIPALVEAYALEDAETILFFSNYVFDVSVEQIFLGVLNGYPLVVTPDELWMDQAAFTAYLKNNQVTYVHMTPSLLSQLDISDVRSIKQIIVAGESINPALIQRMYDEGMTFINAYGPTEATVISTAHTFEQPENRNIIGKPVTNTTVYVLDAFKQPVPKGTPGELYLGGDQIARGYLDQADLTAEKFICNPYQTEAQKVQGRNDRLYQTGDLVRMLEDGTLEYLGRSDFQVKIRGYRIELGEIEETLLQIPGITQAHVMAIAHKTSHEAGSQYLGAYYVATEEIKRETLDQVLGEKLPDYMIPAGYQHLKEFPLTTSGKLDHHQLPAIAFNPSTAYVAPRNENEKVLCLVFKDVLGIDSEIGINDSFFVLGGDSIKAILIVSKLREHGFQTDVRNIMQHKTPRAIGKTLEKAKTLLIDQGEVTGEVALTPIQKDFILNGDQQMHHFNQTIMLESSDQVDEQILKQTLNELVRHHDILRATYRDQKQEIKAYQKDEHFELRIYDYQGLANEETRALEIEKAAMEIQKSINLETGPLFKIGLFRTETKDYLLLCLHHLVIDGVSWRILTEDLSTNYQRIENNEKPFLPQKTSSFQAWSQALERYLESERLKKELPYWEEIEQHIEQGSLASDESNPAKVTKSLKLSLSPEQTSQFLYEAPLAYHAELNDLLLTAVIRGIAEVTGQSTVSINMEGHGRENIDDAVVIDRTVGWFTTVYPLVIKNITQDLAHDICQVKETLRRVPNHGIGYGVLKSLGENLLQGIQPTVTFNYLGEFVAGNESERFQPSTQVKGSDSAEEITFGTAISIDSLIINEQLSMTLSYDGSKYSAQLMMHLQQEISTQLEAILTHCLEVKTPHHTASDFGELTWSQQKFNQVMTKFTQQSQQIECILPLTGTQEGMLYHKLLNPASSEYVMQTTFAIHSAVDEVLLRQSFELVTKRHQTLRSSIVHKHGDEPRQVVLEERSLDFTLLDLSDAPLAENRLPELYAEDVAKGFDLEEDRLIRLILIKLAEEEYRLVMTFHHIIIDGWCNSILMNELLSFYDLLSDGKSVPHLQEQTTYSDYVHYIKNKEAESDQLYWQNLLADYEGAGTIPPLGLSERQEKGIEPVVKSALTPEETVQLEQVAQAYGVTLNTIVEAAWGILLQFTNHEQDVVFGKVVSGRNVNLPGIETMIGLFINTIPTRVTATDNLTFNELIVQLQDQALRSGEHDHYPLAEIQKLSGAGSHLIQSILTFENYFQQAQGDYQLDLQFESNREEVSYDLSVVAYRSDRLALEISYHPEHYSASEIATTLERLKLILCDVAKTPEKKLSEIEMVTRDEVALMSTVQTSTEQESPCAFAPTAHTIVDLFEAQVAKTPDEVALEIQTERLSYRELNEKVNALAHHLSDLDVLPNDKVAIIANRSIEMVVAIYGILKAGGAYVPIDPAAPVERLKYLLEDCAPKVVLTDQVQLEAEINAPIVNLADQAAFCDQSIDNPKRQIQPNDLAYIIYTSGTTGHPKGVMIEHQNLAHYILYAKSAYVTKPPVVPLFTNYTFDLTVTSLFLPLISGGKMIIYSGEIHETIQEVFSNQAITLAKLTPSHLEMAVLLEGNKALPQLETLILGGETLTTQLAHQTLDKYGHHIQIHNEYGPTEATVGCCDYIYHPLQDQEKLAVSIGKPIANTQIWILNQLAICGVGMIGELCIAGAGIARGYLNRAELTAEKFIDHPYGAGKLYRTGDLARFLPDGTLDYLGRMDDQVKIRGYRIELAEIEETLLQIDGISQAHVMAITDEASEISNQYLGAYYVAETEIAPEVLTAQLSQRLPDYMIPAGYQHLSEFPLTTNGKLDQRALPKISFDSMVEYVAPTTLLEKVIASSYETILGISQVGIHDDFFELGGHSLRALRLVNLLAEKTGKAVQVKHLFEAPKVNSLAILLEDLEDSTYERIPKAAESDAYEMSGAQKRMYILWRMAPDSTTYNMPGMLKFEQRLEASELEAATKALTLRHEILRTVFAEQEENLVQVISANPTVTIPVHQIKESEVKVWYEQAIRPFDLENGPLYRIEIVRTEKQDYLFVDMHHIIGDGMSSIIFVQEIKQLLERTPLPVLDRQYKDYSEWMKVQDLSASEHYWLKELDDYPMLALRTDYPRPLEQEFSGATERLVLDEATTKQIKALTQQTSTTAYTFFMSVISILLAKLANQDDLMIGSPVSGRIHRDTEQMLGMFVNTLAIRLRPSAEKSFSDYLSELQSQTLEAGEHQMYPFEDLVEKIAPKRDLSRNPIFDVLMVYQNNEDLTPLMGSANFEEVNTPAKFDLTFTLSDDGVRTYLDLTYATSLFTAETIKVYLVRLTQLLDQVLADPALSIKALNVLLQEEERVLVTEMGSEYHAYPKQQTIVDIFEAQVTQVPNQIAVIYQETLLTYDELNMKANQLAHYLIECYAIKPEDKIGLLLDRSEWMIISILAVLKAGAAYVPISPEHPQERMNYMEEMAEIKVSLVEEKYASQLSNPIIIQALELDDYSISNPETALTSTNLAYIIFTSGTTGRPKGVMIEHHQVNNLIPALKKSYGLEAEETILFISNYVFDASVEQIYLALLNGYQLLISPDQLWMESDKFLTYLNKHQVTYLHMTPALLLQMDLAAIPSLKYVASGGEALSPRLLDKVSKLDFRFMNLYGPTEITVIATTHTFVDANVQNIIGAAITNTTLYVLDATYQIVPKGTIGELYVGGVQVSRGYVNQPELTAERFIQNPYQTARQKLEGWNERIYQTGDLVRMLEDGTLEYHGRSDFQVKIRGYRIELGEIEADLLQVGGITQAHIMAVADHSGESDNQYISAYYVAEEELPREVLNEELARHLPDYMIPSGYKHMSEFPLTVNGKLDQHALPEISFESLVEYVAPTTLMEEIVAKCYSEILFIEQIGIYDDFFQLGGHSLRALKLVNLLEEKTGKAIKIKHIFETSQVVQLAKVLESIDDLVYERIPKAPEAKSYAMSPAQAHMYIFWKSAKTEIAYNIPVVITYESYIDIPKLKSAIEHMITRYETMRTIFAEQDGKLVQIILEHPMIDIPIHDMKESEVKTWYRSSVKPFDLEKGPLLRIEIARTETCDHLFIDLHHIICDGMSATILTRELNQLIEGIPLPVLDRQYKDYSEWMKTVDLSEAANYWESSLRNYPIFDLPLDYQRPSVQQFDGAVELRIIDEATTAKIKALIKKTNATEFMFFLGLTSIFVSKLTSQNDVVIGTGISGRTHRDTEQMIGMFVNVLALRVFPEGEKTFAEYLEELKFQTLEVQEHQDYPFEYLLDELIEEMDYSRNPIFDVLVLYQNNETMESILKTGQAEEVFIPAKFDLAFTLADDGKQTGLILTYATTLFKQETVNKFLLQYMQLLEQILNDSTLAIEEYTIEAE